MGYEIEEIRHLTFEGSKRFEYVETNETLYEIQRQNWDVMLPPFEALKEFGIVDDLRILCCKVHIYIKFTNSFWMAFAFKPGFITDLASVPFWLRGVVDNDDHRALPAVLVHDFLFATQRAPFKIANSLFYKMLLANKYGSIKALLAFWAVSSFIGKGCYDKVEAAPRIWANNHCEMLLARPIEYEGRVYE